MLALIHPANLIQGLPVLGLLAVLWLMFVRPRDPERETWTGRRMGLEGAVSGLGASAAYPTDIRPGL